MMGRVMQMQHIISQQHFGGDVGLDDPSSGNAISQALLLPATAEGSGMHDAGSTALVPAGTHAQPMQHMTQHWARLEERLRAYLDLLQQRSIMLCQVRNKISMEPLALLKMVATWWPQGLLKTSLNCI